MEIAIAKNGFIDINENAQFDEWDDFLSAIRKLFNFEERELQSFDGNSCRMISSHNPTNSIFIYSNPQGTFLYQITSATPFIHLNNMIWNCQTYKMEDIANINKVLQTNTFVDMKKNKRNTKSFFDLEKNSSGFVASYKGELQRVIETKNNFEKSALNSISITNSITTVIDPTIVETTRTPAFTLKIKCLTDLTEMNLETEASDGSYNFLFPIVISPNTTAINDIQPKTTDKLIICDWNGSLIQSSISIADIISTYSESIKSIEVLPFDCSGAEWSNYVTKYETFEFGDGFYYSGGYVGAKITGQCKATPLGIFVPTGETFGQPVTLGYVNDEIDLTFGGGARGFVRTPLGNINLDFNVFTENDDIDEKTANPNTRKGLKITIKTEGWHIGGLAKCEIPPHYVNFYTDNAGQVFIQNLTTNAQELKQLERERVAKIEEQQQQYVLDEVKKAETFNIADIFNPLAWFETGQQSLANATQNEFNKSKINREYQRSLTEYREKIKTQSLLASLTGKQISGNINLFDMLQTLDANSFYIFIETNYYKQRLENYGYYTYIIQPDYDYSVDISTNNYYRKDGNAYEENLVKNVILYTPNLNKPTTCQTIGELVSLIFGFEPSETKNFQIDFSDKIGLNYSVVFRLQNFLINKDSDYNLNFTNILRFPIRRKAKPIRYSNYIYWS